MSISCDLIRSLEQLTEALEGLKQILPEALNLLRLNEFSSITIKLPYKLSTELKEICFHVQTFANTVKSLRKVTDNKDRMERIRAEVRKQGKDGTTHFKREDTAKFPELNDFLTELLNTVRNVDDLSTKIKQLSQEYYRNDISSWIKPAEIKAGEMENAAMLRKFAIATPALIGLGLAAAVSLRSTVAAFSLGISASYILYRKFSHEEAKFNDTQERFKRLNQDALRLLQITGEIKQNTQLLRTEIETCFFRDQPLLLTQIPISLEKLLTSLQFKEVNFEDLTERVNALVKVDLDHNCLL